jgi:hypothetical protein
MRDYVDFHQGKMAGGIAFSEGIEAAAVGNPRQGHPGWRVDYLRRASPVDRLRRPPPQDVGMTERAGGAALSEQPALTFRVEPTAGVQELDRDVALEPWIPRLEHLAHSAFANASDDPIWADIPVHSRPPRAWLAIVEVLGGKREASSGNDQEPIGRGQGRRRNSLSSQLLGWGNPSSTQMSERALASEVKKP